MTADDMCTAHKRWDRLSLLYYITILLYVALLAQQCIKENMAHPK